ncbi:MAG: hypothetical protein SA339_13525 [Methanomassiliicoccus sp.]|nr:hypothetical protein [Methanomassiliicoccus sp.]
MVKKLTYEEMDAAYSRNAKIIEELESNIRKVSQGLVGMIKMGDKPDGTKAGPYQFYELVRIFLDNSIEGNEPLFPIPADIEEYKAFIEEETRDHIGIIDSLIEKELPGVEGPADLAYNLKQYVKSCCYGIATIIEENPEMANEELLENLATLQGGLLQMLFMRAGCVSTDDFDDDRLYELTE